MEKKAVLNLLAISQLGLGSLCVMAASALAQADHGGNGGGVHVCYDGLKVDENGNRVIKSVEMYDLYEGRERYKFRTPLPAGLVTEQDFLNYAYQQAEAKSGMQKVGNRAFAARVEAAVGLVNRSISFTNQVLDLVPDANRLMHGENCIYDQLANWDDRTELLLVREKYFDYIKQDPLNLAAFKTHEAYYFLDRLYNGAKYSDSARESNARTYLTQNGLLKVQVPIFEQKDSLTIIHPAWNKASCFNYSLKESKSFWFLSIGRIGIQRLPEMKATQSKELFISGVSRYNLESFQGRSWGNAWVLFELFSNRRYDAKLIFEERTCEDSWSMTLGGREPFLFTVEP